MKKHLGMKRSETVNRKRKTRIRRSVLQKQNMTHRKKKKITRKRKRGNYQIINTRKFSPN